MSADVDQWEAPRQIPENEQLITWARSQGEPYKRGGIDFDGYELHAHPDLGDLVPQLVDNPVLLVNAFGVPALATARGVIFAFAFGSRLYIRSVSIPDAEYLDELGNEWAGVLPWFPPNWTTLALEERQAEKASAQSDWLSRVRWHLSEAQRRIGAEHTGS